MKNNYISILILLASVFSSAGAYAQFGSDVKIYDMPAHNETRVSIDVAFNGWVYAAFTYDSGLIIRMSKDNGDSWQTIDSGSHAGTVYPAVKLLVTGNDTNSLRLFELSDAYVASSNLNLLYLIKWDGRTGAYMNYVALDNFAINAVRGFDIASDAKFPSVISNPYSIAVVYGTPNANDSLFVVTSIDSGNTFSAKKLVATTSRYFRDVSIAYGIGSNYSDGRLFMAWEQLQQSTDRYGSIYEAHTPSFLTDAPTAPFNIDGIYPTTAGQLRGPKISCSQSATISNDSNDITELIAVERQSTGFGNENILGFRNMSAVGGTTWLGFDIVNTANVTQRPDLSFDPAYNNFLLTYFDSTALHLPYLVNNFNLVNYQNWGVVSNNYADDTTTLVDPRPTVRINPALTRVAVGWTKTVGGNGISMFDAEYRNPLPAITSLSPDTVLAGNTAFTLGVNGTNFNNTSVVNWNGAPQTTAYVNPNSVNISVPASAVITPGTVQVTVSNPTTYGGGGTSNSVTFYIKGPNGIQEPSAAGVINVYPNPASNDLSISYSVNGSSAVEISLYDITGKLVKQLLNETLTGKGVANVDVSSIAQGEYNLVMKSVNGTDAHKIIVAH